MTETDSDINFGVLTYDVPISNRGAYSKIRGLIRRKSIMQTASAYLIPWGMRDAIVDSLDKMNEDKPKAKRVSFKVFPYASEANEVLDKEVVRGIHTIIKTAKLGVEKSINKARKVLHEAEMTGDTTIEYTMEDVYKRSLSKARREIKIAQSLAIIFSQEGSLDTAIEAAHIAVVAQVEVHRTDDKDNSSTDE